ncbi:uncharacterized protein EKO05_0002835 [Ascochyta rabiei]|uniref:Uncharacterized protein n=1 Tax=Didymella rabiei TaxID=5454 RepID=A0A163EH27_DIDRA|nr:uncharacterized protein EKO05_0002835 [Ascochyta rabiei]KZM23694.1 hypothetical protein ST47_g5154 [Ascochyta rabiei]UPX12280.1 hypothetical protein EKO05_0002835 [Ascochyta rabiei]
MFQQALPELELQHPPQASHAAHFSTRGGLRAPTSPLRQFTAPPADDELNTFDNIDLSAAIPPPPSVLTSNATAYDPHADLPSPLEDYPRAARSTHQRTLTGTFLNNSQSLLTRATSTLQQHTSAASIRSHSPSKSLASFLPSRSAIDSTKSWFNGSSAPVKLGIQQQDEDSVSESGSEIDSEFYSSDSESEGEGDAEANNTMNIFNRKPTHTRAASETPVRSEQMETLAKPQHQSPASSRFAWLLSTQKNAAVPSPTPAPTYHNADDELLNLNISQALFPHGSVDPLAPSSFNDLLANAEALLSRYQKSYRQLSTALVDAHSEQSAQDDELDEAETRARHLKMQLETMAAKATEQDEQMRVLMEDLAFERHARQEEEAARKRSLALIRSQPQCSCQDTPRRRNRISNSELSIDSGFESDAETDAASLFSRNCLSPTGTDRSSILEVEADATPKNKKVQSLQRGGTYDKPRGGSVSVQSWGCANCEGGSQASVWGRLSKEREENRVLRHRVEALEEAVEGALDAVGGQWGLP